MTNKEAISNLEHIYGIVSSDIQRSIDLAIEALKHEDNWEDIEEALNGWLNNIVSPNTALNDVYRAYKRR